MKNSDMVTIRLTKRQIVTVLCSLIAVKYAVSETRPVDVEPIMEIHDAIKKQLDNTERRRDNEAQEREFRKGLGI